jgi:acid phosphatase
MSARRLAAAVVLAAAAAALSGGSPQASAAGSPCGRVGTAPAWRHVIVIAFENHSYADVLGAGAPRSEFTKLAGECGVAKRFTASHFPHSLPAYIAATSGAIPITGDCLPGPSCESTDASIFTQLGGPGWRLYGESMPQACATANSTDYVTRHIPALYYTRIDASTCAADVRPLPATPPAVKRRFVWVSPNQTHDMERGTLSQASSWLHTFLEGPDGLLTRRPYTNGHTAVFIWFDTGADTDTISTPLPFIVISPSTPHTSTTTALDDMSALRVWERMLGLKCLNAACTAKGMAKPFDL